MPRNAKSFRKSRYRQNRKICSVCFKQIQGGYTNSPWRSDPIGRCDLARRLGFHKLGLRIGVRPQFQNALEELRLSISVRWAGEHKGSSVESAYVYSDLFFSMLICSSSHLLRSLIHFVAFLFWILKIAGFNSRPGKRLHEFSYCSFGLGAQTFRNKLGERYSPVRYRPSL